MHSLGELISSRFYPFVHFACHASNISVAWIFNQRSLYGLLHWEGIDTYVSPALFDNLSDDFATDDIDDTDSHAC